MSLTVEQRARRAVTRRNNKIAERYPLFAEQFATTYDDELARLRAQDTANKVYFAKMQVAEAQAWARGARRRRVAKRLLPREQFIELDAKFWHTYPLAREKAQWFGAKFADWWWQALRGTPWAFEHCPNARYHNQPGWWMPRYNYLHKVFVTPIRCPTCGIPRPRNLTPHAADGANAPRQQQLFSTAGDEPAKASDGTPRR